MSIFPKITTINVIQQNKDDEVAIGKVIDMDFDNNKASIRINDGVVIMATTLKRKIEIYIQTLLRTEVNKYNVYKDNNFGVDYFRFKGRGDYPFSYIKADVQKTIETKALMFRGIKSTRDYLIELEGDKLKVSFILININDEEIVVTERGI